MKPKSKWKFAIGTTSRVPYREGYHYLIADFDREFPECKDVITAVLEAGDDKHIWERTKHGWHLYTDLQYEFPRLVEVLTKIGADPSWIEIGKERGYFFLAHKSYIRFHWPVEYMMIHHAKETHDTKAS